MIVEVYKSDDKVMVLIDGSGKRFNCEDSAFIYLDGKVSELKSSVETAKAMFLRTNS